MIYPPVYVLRHGQTEWNAEHRLQGDLDSPLTEQGRAQAGRQHQTLKKLDLSGYAAFSSPQGRAFHTASIALDGLIPSIKTDQRLSEIGVGDWRGLRVKDLSTERPMDESQESIFDLYERAPNGEGFLSLRERCVAFLNDLPAPSVLVTHGITSRMIRLILLDMDISEIGDLPGGQGVVFGVENKVQIKL